MVPACPFMWPPSPDVHPKLLNSFWTISLRVRKFGMRMGRRPLTMVCPYIYRGRPQASFGKFVSVCESWQVEPSSLYQCMRPDRRGELFFVTVIDYKRWELSKLFFFTETRQVSNGGKKRRRTYTMSREDTSSNYPNGRPACSEPANKRPRHRISSVSF